MMTKTELLNLGKTLEAQENYSDRFNLLTEYAKHHNAEDIPTLLTVLFNDTGPKRRGKIEESELLDSYIAKVTNLFDGVTEDLIKNTLLIIKKELGINPVPVFITMVDVIAELVNDGLRSEEADTRTKINSNRLSSIIKLDRAMFKILDLPPSKEVKNETLLGNVGMANIVSEFFRRDTDYVVDINNPLMPDLKRLALNIAARPSSVHNAILTLSTIAQVSLNDTMDVIDGLLASYGIETNNPVQEEDRLPYNFELVSSDGSNEIIINLTSDKPYKLYYLKEVIRQADRVLRFTKDEDMANKVVMLNSIKLS